VTAYHRRVRAGWPLWLVIGCYGPSPTTGAPCDPTLNNCPAGQECRPAASGFACGGGGDPGIDAPNDAPVLDAVPDAAAADIDGDGLLNAADNCPTMANADQADDESDGLGDVCDPCPVNSNNVDGDDDGVGDVCDPNPTVPGESIVLFESFRGGVRPAGWTIDGPGTWTFSGGEARVELGGGQTGALRTSLIVTPRTMAFTALTVEDTNGPDYSAGLANPFTPAYHGSYCTLHRGGGGGNGGGKLVSLYNLTTDEVIDNVTMSWARGVTYVLVAHRDGTANDCVVANVSGIVLATPSGPNTSSHSGPQTVAERAAIPSAIQVFMMPFRTLGQR